MREFEGGEMDPREKAKGLYLSGKKLKEISEELNIKYGTIRQWKARDKWPRISVTKKRNKNQSVTLKKSVTDEATDGLTEKQKFFCLNYVGKWNATQAAIKAGYSKETAYSIGSQLLRNVKVAAEIRRLKSEIVRPLFIDASDIVEKYIEIAFTDIGDYVTFGRRDVQVMTALGPLYEGKGKDKKAVMKTVNYVDIRESDTVDTSLICEISQGKEGIKIKRADQMKALDWLSKYFELNPMDKHRKEYEDRKQQLDRERFEFDKKNKELW